MSFQAMKFGMAASVALLLGASTGCATYDQTVQIDPVQSAAQRNAAQWHYLDGISRLELAQIANNAVIAKPRTVLVNSTERAPYFTTVADHEDGFRHLASDDVRKTRNLRVATYEVQNLTSVAEEIPAGWREVEIGLLHENSGMICIYGLNTQDESFSLNLTDIRLFDETSTDVGCDYRTKGGGLITTFASYWPDMSQEVHFAAADKQIREQFTTDKSLDVVLAVLDDYNAATMGTPSASGYDISEQNSLQKIKSSVWVVKTQGWHVKVRATHFMTDEMTELFASLMHNRAHVEVYKKNTGAPTGDIDV